MKPKRETNTLYFFVVLMWSVESLNFFMAHKLHVWGIFPRTVNGLWGIPLSPFIHGSPTHLLLNTVPLLVLGYFVILQGKGLFLRLSIFIIFFGGSLVWLFGRTSFHVGASGLIFGYFGFLVASVWYTRTLKSVLLSSLTLFVYGGIVWGVLPIQAGVSWEGHLFGLVAGIAGAKYSRLSKS